MRILVLTHEYPPVGGGGGRVAQDICRALVEQQHSVQVLTAHWGDLPSEEEDEGVIVRRIRSGRRWPYKAGFRAMMGYVAKGIWCGQNVIRQWKPDLMHVHFAVPAGAAAFILSRLTGIPYVLTVHLGDVPGGVPEKTGRWFRWIFPFTPPIWHNAAAVTAVSEYTRQLAIQHYSVPIQVIPNGVNLKDLNPGKIQIQTPPQIVFAGRFMAQKNPVGLVRILAQLRDLPWRCTILGDGPLRAEVEGEISNQGLLERFKLPGWVNPQEVIQTFRQCDILFMPSLSEGFPVVGVQALSMGLALVLSRVGGCVDLVNEGENGYLLKPDDYPGFSEALRCLISNPDQLQRYREASRRLASQYNLDAVVESYAQVFSRAYTPIN